MEKKQDPEAAQREDTGVESPPDERVEADENEIIDAEDIPEAANARPPRLTPKQRKIAEWVAGIFSALVIFALMFFLRDSEDGLLRNAFLIAFILAMFLPRYFENKYKTQFNIYRKSLLIGCVIAFVVYLLGITLLVPGGFSNFFKSAS